MRGYMRWCLDVGPHIPCPPRFQSYAEPIEFQGEWPLGDVFSVFVETRLVEECGIGTSVREREGEHDS